MSIVLRPGMGPDKEAYQAITLFCDHDGCIYQFPTPAELLENAHSSAWKNEWISRGEKDYCPLHAKKYASPLI